MKSTPLGGQSRRPMMNESIEEMLVAILRIRAVRREAVRLLLPAHFSRAQELHLAVLWSEVVRLHVLYPEREAIPYMALYDGCREVAYTPGSGLDEAQVHDLLDIPETIDRSVASLPGMIYHAYYDVPADQLDRDFGIRLLKRFLIERGAAEPLMRQVEVANRTGALVHDISALLEPARKLITQVEQIDRTPSRSLLRDLDELKPLAFCHTGLSFLDKFMGGGPAAPEIYGLMAPTGGGKSTMFGQLLAERAKLYATMHLAGAPARQAFMFSYEDDFDRMWLRAIAHLADVSKDEIEKGPSQFSTRGHLKDYERALFARQLGKDFDPATHPGERERIEMMMAATHGHLRIHDMSADGLGGIDEIVDRLERDIELDGCRPGAVFIDSLNLLVARSLGPNVRDLTSTFAARMTSAMSELRARVGSRFGVDVGVTNQTKGSLAKRGIAVEISHSEGAGSTTWAQACDFAFAIGNMNDMKVAQLYCTKARRTRHGGGPPALIQLDGPFGRWLDASEEFIVHGDKIVRKSTGEMFVAPARRRGTRIDEVEEDDAIAAPATIRKKRTS